MIQIIWNCEQIKFQVKYNNVTQVCELLVQLSIGLQNLPFNFILISKAYFKMNYLDISLFF